MDFFLCNILWFIYITQRNRPCYSRCGTIKISPCSTSKSAEQRPYFAQPFPCIGNVSIWNEIFSSETKNNFYIKFINQTIVIKQTRYHRTNWTASLQRRVRLNRIVDPKIKFSHLPIEFAISYQMNYAALLRSVFCKKKNCRSPIFYQRI